MAIVAGSFLASVTNAAFSAGGAMIILATTSTVLPISAVVPIHSTLLIGSTASRAAAFRKHVAWHIAVPFGLASIAAVAIAARLYFALPETMLATAIAIVMLVAIWLPAISWRPRIRHPWVLVGFVHSFLSTLFAYGALLHAVILHTGLKRREVIGTMAVSLTAMGVLKIAGYAANGFDYTPYLLTIALAVAATLLGTWVGKAISERVSEETFRLVFRALVTLTAMRLLYVSYANA